VPTYNISEHQNKGLKYTEEHQDLKYKKKLLRCIPEHISEQKTIEDETLYVGLSLSQSYNSYICGLIF